MLLFCVVEIDDKFIVIGVNVLLNLLLRVFGNGDDDVDDGCDFGFVIFLWSDVVNNGCSLYFLLDLFLFLFFWVFGWGLGDGCFGMIGLYFFFMIYLRICW